MQETSCAFFSGRITFVIPFSFALMTIGSAPLIGCTHPSSPSSPKKAISSRSTRGFSTISPMDSIIPTAIGRSKDGPSFFISAGARLTVYLNGRRFFPLFMIAAFTRSLLSRTDVSGRPIISIAGIPLILKTSTWTGYPFTPLTPKLSVLAMIPLAV